MLDRIPMEEDPIVAMNSIAKDSPVTTRKGRPGAKRKMGGLKLQKPKGTTCSVCHEKDHDARTCKIHFANPEKYPLALFQ
jgi:hypothetical protein